MLLAGYNFPAFTGGMALTEYKTIPVKSVRPLWLQVHVSAIEIGQYVRCGMAATGMSGMSAINGV